LRGFKEGDPPLRVPEARAKGARWLSEIKMERIQWFWWPYIPIGKITMLGGDPGMGKSYIALAVAAAVTQGDPLPGQGSRSNEPMNVLILAGEDDPSDTLKPRLVSLNADQDKVAIFADDIILDDHGIRVIRELMESTSARLLIVDPIVAFLGAKMDMNRSNEVRPRMKALANIGRDFNAAVLVVRHLRKQGSNGVKGKDIYNGAGSIDFTAAVRSELQVSEGKDGTLYLNHIKSNVGPKGKSISYSINDDEFEWGTIIDSWEVNRQSRVSRKFATEDKARLFIFDFLRDHPEGLPSNDIYMAANAMKIGDKALRAAKAGLVIVWKEGTRWLWKLDPKAKRVEDPEELSVINGNE
jgi:hypothetical protein